MIYPNVIVAWTDGVYSAAGNVTTTCPKLTWSIAAQEATINASSGLVTFGSIGEDTEVTATYNPTAKFNLKIVKVQMLAVSIESAHDLTGPGVEPGTNLLVDWNSNYEEQGQNQFPLKGWAKIPGAETVNCPVSHTMGKKVTVKVILRVNAPCLLDLTGDGGVDGLRFKVEKQPVQGDVAITMTSTAPLPAHVDIIEKSINWTAKAYHPQDQTRTAVVPVLPASSGPHKMYITFGEPERTTTVNLPIPVGVDPIGPLEFYRTATEIRMKWACEKALGLGDTTAIAEAIWNACPTGNVQVGSAPQDWGLLDQGNLGDCDNLARLMAMACRLLGIAAEPRFICGSQDVDCLKWEQEKNTEGRRKWILLMFGPQPNAYEGVCFVGGFYYAVAPKKKADSDVNMLRLLHNDGNVSSQQWYWIDPSTAIPSGPRTDTVPTGEPAVPFP